MNENSPNRPELPTDGCTCGNTTFTYWETGYTRCEPTERDTDGVVVILTRGWDAMSEGGDDAWLSCDGCGATFEVPDDVDWQ
jgi:hypothetical protein